MLYDSKNWDKNLPAKFKSAEELQIPENHYVALLKTLELFESGKVPRHMFTMHFIGAPECGTAGCILGWAATFEPLMRNGFRPEAVGPLFYPSGPDGVYKANVQQGAKALRGFLTTGNARAAWREAMKEGE